MGASGERRIVTVLISDVVDSTVIAERLGPERSKFLFDELGALMAEQVRRFDGTVAQLTGDGLLALFGAPVAHGDDAERAVRAAQAIHEALDRYGSEVAEAYGIALAARVVRIVEDRGRAGGAPATTGGFVPQAMPGHSHRIGLDHDPESANELLAAAGFPGGRGLPEIRLATPLTAWGEPVATQWREQLHAEVTLVLHPIDGAPRDLAPAAACWVHGWSGDIPDPAGFLVPVLLRSTAMGASAYRSREVDELFERFVASRSRAERLGLVEQLERLWLGRDVALVPLWYPTQPWLRRPWVQGFWTTPITPGHLSDIVVRRDYDEERCEPVVAASAPSPTKIVPDT